MYYYERPDYDKARFLSDIGGAAGLILGMSIASILGFIDCIFIYFIRCIRQILKGVKIHFCVITKYFRRPRRQCRDRIDTSKMDKKERTPEMTEKAERPEGDNDQPKVIEAPKASFGECEEYSKIKNGDKPREFVSIELHQDMYARYVKRHIYTK